MSNHFKGMLKTRQKNNIMTPLNWLVGIVETILTSGLIGTSILHQLWLQVFLSILMTSIIVFYCKVYIYFMLRDPDRLQTESYRLASQEIALNVGNIKTADKLIPVNNTGVLPISGSIPVQKDKNTTAGSSSID
jgi:hypothetical protein